jgi:predicted secreted hydrolase
MLVIIICLLAGSSLAGSQEYSDVTSGYEIRFPRDFYYKKDYRVQWWYFTGHLFDQDGREFGYELTFFVVNVQKRNYTSRFGVNNVYISHFALSDIAGNTFYFFDKADSGAYGFAGAKNDRLNVWINNNAIEGTIDKIRIRASEKDKAIDLQLIPVKPIVLNGENGYSRKSGESPLIASYYFSYTNLYTEGMLTIGSKNLRVKGKSWFDREISTRGAGEHLTGWDWFAIQLDDKREIMLYMLRDKDGSVNLYSSGTFVDQDGKYRHLFKNDFSIKVVSNYRSGKTTARYPSQWEITIPSEKVTLFITPLLQDQEILAYNSTGNYYWEGTCKVEGSAKGRAYVEMTGY